MIIKDNVNTQDPYQVSDERKKALLNAVVLFVVYHQQTFNLVNNIRFRISCKLLNLHYFLLSQAILTHSFHDHFDETLTKIWQTIDLIEMYISITLYCWSSWVLYG